MTTYDQLLEVMDSLGVYPQSFTVDGILISDRDNPEDLLMRVPLPKKTLWVKSSHAVPSGMVLLMRNASREPRSKPATPELVYVYRWKPVLRGNTCPQCKTGPLQHERTEDFITDGWRGQRWHYTCNHCDWIGSEEVAVGPYEEDERD